MTSLCNSWDTLVQQQRLTPTGALVVSGAFGEITQTRVFELAFVAGSIFATVLQAREKNKTKQDKQQLFGCTGHWGKLKLVSSEHCLRYIITPFTPNDDKILQNYCC